MIVIKYMYLKLKYMKSDSNGFQKKVAQYKYKKFINCVRFVFWLFVLFCLLTWAELLGSSPRI